jgi:hypothetical protein
MPNKDNGNACILMNVEIGHFLDEQEKFQCSFTYLRRFTLVLQEIDQFLCSVSDSLCRRAISGSVVLETHHTASRQFLG